MAVTYGVDITKLKRSKETTGIIKVEMFFKKHSNKAYRSVELEEIFKNKMSKYVVRNAVRKLYREGKLIKKQISQAKSFYYWNMVFEKKDNKIKKAWGKSPKKVSFVGTEIIRKPKKITFKLKGEK